MITLNTEQLLLSLTGNIIVVGNAPTFKNNGPTIDNFDIIFRFNNYRIEGYEKNIGNRTSFRVISTWRDLEPYNAGIEICPFTQNSPEAINRKNYERASSVPVIYASKDVRNLLKGYPRPSTGLAFLTILAALKIPAAITGFSGCDDGYYWNNKHRQHAHDSNLERLAISKLPGIFNINEITQRPGAS